LVVLLFDDLHWVDEVLFELVLYLLRCLLCALYLLVFALCFVEFVLWLFDAVCMVPVFVMFLFLLFFYVQLFELLVGLFDEVVCECLVREVAGNLFFLQELVCLV